jgi:hydrogenase nickel incorporation protein HypA/HybF
VLQRHVRPVILHRLRRPGWLLIKIKQPAAFPQKMIRSSFRARQFDMHEMALIQGVLRIAEDAARKEGFTRVRAIRLEIGALAPVEPQALRFCFDAAARATLAEGARLEIDFEPGSAWCMQCNKAVALQAACESCPECGGERLQVTGGTQMRVRELEVE